MWSGACSTVELIDSSGCVTENRLCFLKLPAGIFLRSVLDITLTVISSESSPEGPVSVQFRCRAYDHKTMISRNPGSKQPSGGSNSVLHLTRPAMGVYKYTVPEGSKVKISVDTVKPSYRLTPAPCVIIHPPQASGYHPFGPNYPSPAVLHHRLLQCMVSPLEGVMISTEIDMNAVHCSLTISPSSLSGDAAETHFLVTRKTQIVIADQYTPSPKKFPIITAEISFDIQDEAVSIPILSQVDTYLNESNNSGPGSLLINGPVGMGKASFVHGLVEKLNTGKGEVVTDRLSIECLSVDAAVLSAQGKEYCDSALHSRLGYALMRAREVPIVLVLEDLDILVPAKSIHMQHTMSAAEEGVVDELQKFFAFIRSPLSRSTGKKSDIGPTTSLHYSQDFRIFVFGTTSDLKSVNPSVARCFEEKATFKNPSSQCRQRAVEILYNCLRRDIGCARVLPVESPQIQTFLDQLAEEGSGTPMTDLLFQWKNELTTLLKVRSSGADFDEVMENMNSLNLSSDMQTGAKKEVDVILPLSGVCGLEGVKRVLREVVVWPRVHAKIYRQYGLKPCSGVLFYGPPGTGKTLIAKQIAKELKGRFISLKLSDILRGHIGVGEQRIRELFAEAKTYAPSVLFIDEFQSLFSARVGLEQGPGGGEGATDAVGASLTSALALCLDDIGTWNTYAGTASLITVIAATNEPWAVDSGFLRPGRFDKKVFVGPLDTTGRYFLLKDAFSMYNVSSEDGLKTSEELLMDVATQMSSYFTGADITLFTQKVKLAHFRKNGDMVTEAFIGKSDGSVKLELKASVIFDELNVFTPSVSQRDLNEYSRWGGRA